MEFYDTLRKYKILDYGGIQYTTCRDFKHISRYRVLRQVLHNPHDDDTRFVSLETPNPFVTNTDVIYYDVPAHLENRLDIIAYEKLGNPNYAWIIAYINKIEDGYTVLEGQRLMIPKSITSFFKKGEILAPVNPFMLNLGVE